MPIEPMGERREADVVLIGTSPLIMMQALHFHHQGKRVLMVDRADRMGGAWFTRDVWDFKRLEMGSHVIRNRRPAYRFLEQVLGIPLSPPDGLEFGFIGNRRVPLPVYRLRNELRSIWHDVRTRAFTHARASLPRLRRIVRNLRVPFQYPIDGCFAINRRLSGMIEEAGINVELGQDVERIDVDADRQGGVCHTSFGPVAFRHVLFGQNAHCELRVGGKPFPFALGTKTVTSLLLHLNGRRRHNFTYFELRGDSLLKRVRNIGVFLDPAIEEPDMVLIVHPHRSAYLGYADESEFAEQVLARLVELDVLVPETSIVAYEPDHWDVARIHHGEVDRISRELGPAVAVQRTWDIGEELTTLVQAPGALMIPPHRSAHGALRRPR